MQNIWDTVQNVNINSMQWCENYYTLYLLKIVTTYEKLKLRNIIVFWKIYANFDFVIIWATRFKKVETGPTKNWQSCVMLKKYSNWQHIYKPYIYIYRIQKRRRLLWARAHLQRTEGKWKSIQYNSKNSISQC